MTFEVTLKRIKNRPVLVMGDLMLDHTIYGIVKRRSPEAAIPILERQGEVWVLGGCGNVASNAAALGSKVYLLGLVGADSSAEIVKKNAKEAGIHAFLTTDTSRPTTLKERGIATKVDEEILKKLGWPQSVNHHIFRNDLESTHPINKKTEQSVMEQVADIIPAVSCVIIADYNKGFLTKNLCQYVINESRKRDIFVMVDPKADFSKYRNANIIKPNREELRRYSGYPSLLGEYSFLKERKAAYRTIIEEHFDALLLTKSEKGMILYDSDGYLKVGAVQNGRKVEDVTGAGDTVSAAFALAKTSGASLREAAIIANYAASAAVGKPGTSTISVKELLLETKKTCKTKLLGYR